MSAGLRFALVRELQAHAYAILFPLWYPERFACIMAYSGPHP